MAAEFTSNARQNVAANQNVLFTETAIPCRRGYVIHREGSGIITLRGIVNCPQACYATYEVSFGANIAIPTEPAGTAGPISVAIAIDGESLPTSSAIVTPAAPGDFWNVYVTANIRVPRGCCYTISVENTSDQAIDVQNANIKINRVA